MAEWDHLDSTLDKVLGTPLSASDDTASAAIDAYLRDLDEEERIAGEMLGVPQSTPGVTGPEVGPGNPYGVIREGGPNAVERGLGRIRSQIVGGVGEAIEFGIATAKTLQYIDAPAKYEHATRARNEKWKGLIPDISLRPFSAEGELAMMEWPMPSEIRRRQQAVVEADLMLLEQNGVDVSDLRGQMAAGGPTFAQDKVDALIKQHGLLPTNDDTIITELEKSIAAEEREVLWRVPLPNFGGIGQFVASLAGHAFETPDKSIRDTQLRFLAHHNHSPEAIEAVERANQLWEEQGLDPDLDTGWDIAIHAGIRYAPADIATVVLQDPLLILGPLGGAMKAGGRFVGRKFLGASKGANVLGTDDVVEIAKARTGIIPSLSQKMEENAKVYTELTKVEAAAGKHRMAVEKAFARQHTRKLTPSEIKQREGQGALTGLEADIQAPEGFEATVKIERGARKGRKEELVFRRVRRKPPVEKKASDIAIERGAVSPEVVKKGERAVTIRRTTSQELERRGQQQLPEQSARGGDVDFFQPPVPEEPGAIREFIEVEVGGTRRQLTAKQLEELETRGQTRIPGIGDIVADPSEIKDVRLTGGRRAATAKQLKAQEEAGQQRIPGVEAPRQDPTTVEAGFRSLGRQTPEETATGTVTFRPRFLDDIDETLAEDAARRSRVQAEVVTTVRNSLLDEDLVPEDLLDDVLTAAADITNKKPLSARLAEVFAEDADSPRVSMVRNAIAPVRAFTRYLDTIKPLGVSPGGRVVNRVSQLREAYRRTFQEKSALEHEAIEQLTDLGLGDPEVLGRLNHLTTAPTSWQPLVEEIARTGVGRSQFRTLTGYNLWHRRGMLMTRDTLGNMFRWSPKAMLGQTENWKILREADQAQMVMTNEIMDRTTREFGWLKGKDRGPTPGPAFDSLSQHERMDLDRRIGMALDSDLVEEIPATGAQTYRFSDVGPVIHLTPEERAAYESARTWLDDIAQEVGLERGAKISDVMEAIYPRSTFVADGRHAIPPELVGVVGPHYLLRHLQPDEMIKALAKGQVPTLTDIIEKVAHGAPRAIYFEPALKAANESAKVLSPLQRMYWGAFHDALRGKPQGIEPALNTAIGIGLDHFRALPGVARVLSPERAARLKIRPAYRMSIAASNAVYRAMLGGMVSSGVQNFLQSVNTAGRVGYFNFARGIAWGQTTTGRRLYEQSGVMNNFRELFEKPIAGNEHLRAFGVEFKTIDDLVMSPMFVAENKNRGMAYLSGISDYFNGKLNSIDDLFKLPHTEIKAALAHAVDNVESTQFIYGKFGTMPFFQGIMARQATSLATFPVKQAEYLVTQMREDPTGFLRFLALSGYISRLGREVAGVDLNNAVGFGFIPEDIGPAPGLSPQANMMLNALTWAMSKDPDQKKRAMNDVHSAFSAIASGVAAGRVPPAILVMGYPGTTIPLAGGGEIPPAPLKPAEELIDRRLETDLGSRFAKNILRFWRQQATGEKRSRGGNLIDPDVTPGENIRQGLGFQLPENVTRYGREGRRRGLEAQTTFLRSEIGSEFARAVREQDTERIDALIGEIEGDDLPIVFEILKAGGLDSMIESNLRRQLLPQDLRTIEDNPNLLATPEGQLILRQLQGGR